MQLVRTLKSRGRARGALAAALLACATLSLAACGEPAPRAGESRPTVPAYGRAAPLPPPLPPVARRPAYVPPAYTAPPPAPASRTSPPVAYAPTTAYDWRDVPLPAGDWAWTARAGGSEARYGPGGQPPIAILVCDRAAGVVRLAVPAVADPGVTRSATITTSTTTSTFVAMPQPIDALSTLAVSLPVSHRMLDAMAYSRGRFRIEIGGIPAVILPSWSEVGRVVEDCRSQG